MREIPILMNGPMVRATLADLKTVTRRIVKPQPSGHHWQTLPGYVGDYRHEGDNLWHFAHRIPQNRSWDCDRQVRCPYGQPGDRLWVRETFALEHCVEHDQEPPFTDGRPVRRRDEPGEARWVQPHYRATDPTPELAYEFGCSASCPENDPHVHWKPSIHMPRWASRITLEVTGVRVKRLQDITEAQAIAEGLHRIDVGSGYGPRYSAEPARWADVVEGTADAYEDPRLAFRDLWQSINGSGSWDANPWVRAVEFKRIEQERMAA